MSGWQRFWRAETSLFLGIWSALMVLGRSQLFRDPGTFWHTVMGQHLLAARRFLDTDPFSFTFAGRPWIPHEWLAECAMAIVHEVSGFDGLLLATATTLAALYTWLGHRLLRAGLHWLPTTLIVVLAMAASSTSFHVRPHVASIAFLGVTFALLTDFEAGRAKLGRLWWLVPLFVVWTNWHGAVLGGMATLGLVAGGWTLTRLVGFASPLLRTRQAVVLWLVVLACGLTPLVNPYGWRLPATWLEIMGSPVIPRLIVEHAPPHPRQAEFWIIAALGLVSALVFASTLPRRPRVTWLVPFVWFALTLSRIRHAPLFGVVAVLAIADMLPHSRLASWLARPGRDLFRLPALPGGGRFDPRPFVLPVVLILLCGTLQATGVRVPVLGRGWAELDRTIWPVELLPELRQAERDHPEGARVFNDHRLGGFLIYEAPWLKVFIDDRCEVYGDAWLEQFDRAGSTDLGLMDRWLAEYRVDYVLVATGSNFDPHIAQQPGWRRLGQCPVAAFYGRVPR